MKTDAYKKGHEHGIVGIYNNPYSDKNDKANFMQYHNGHNQGNWDKRGIFVAIFEEAATDTDTAKAVKEHVKEREGRLFWEDNKRWQEDPCLTPSQLLSQIRENNKTNGQFTGYESI